jgi:hypothetical protein
MFSIGSSSAQTTYQNVAALTRPHKRILVCRDFIAYQKVKFPNRDGIA